MTAKNILPHTYSSFFFFGSLLSGLCSLLHSRSGSISPRGFMPARILTPQVATVRAILPILFTAGMILFLPTWAHAERPWQDSPKSAILLDDRVIVGSLSPIITALPDGTLYSLDPQGRIQRIDTVTGRLFPLTELPPLSLLTATPHGLWAITRAERPVLLNLSVTGQILNHIALEGVSRPGSHFSSLQISNSSAFIADEGKPAMIVVDLDKGTSQRLLENNPSLMAHRPLKRGGKMLTTATGQNRSGGNIRFMVMDHKEQWLFYQSPPGPLYRLGISVLTDPLMTPAQQIEAMSKWRDTPSLGGLGLWRDDSLYMVDIDHGDILKFGTDREPWRLLHDPVLFGAQDIALLPKTARASIIMAVLVQKAGQTHLLTYGLP